MADLEHEAILAQGVDFWNTWRSQNPNIRPDLSKSNLSGKNLESIDLSFSNLTGANLYLTNLANSNLRGSDLTISDCTHANLWASNLRFTNFFGANLQAAMLWGADISFSNLSETNLEETNFDSAILAHTTFAFIRNLDKAVNLDLCNHTEASSIDHNTLINSGDLPTSFLRGIGLTNTYIDHMQAIFSDRHKYSSCFILFARDDKEFYQKLHDQLQEEGIRCWPWIDRTIWNRAIYSEIDQKIRANQSDKLIVIMSKNSLKYQSFIREIDRVLQLELDKRKEVLFPIRLDEAIFEWEGYPRKGEIIKRVVGDFSDWEDSIPEQAFKRLLKEIRKN